jgi:NADH dehydrogenase
MERILVVGATGQLGAAVIRKLTPRGVAIRPLVRTTAGVDRFERLGTEPVIGDLTDAASLSRACAGISTIIATANAAIPSRATDTFEAVERDGYRDLIQAATAAGVRRFVFTSVPLSKMGERLSPLVRYKRQTEMALVESGLEHVIFRANVFMDVAFAMMGSILPLEGSEEATVLRPFGFARRYFGRIKNSMGEKHVAFIPGDGTTHHAFICIEDVAAFLTAAVFSGSGIHAIGGPEMLSFLDVVHIYERVLGITLRVQGTPATIFRIAIPLLRPFSPAAANIMCLNYLVAKEDTPANPAAAAEFGVQLTSAEAFLRGKKALAAAG